MPIKTISLCNGEDSHTTLLFGTRLSDLQVARKEAYEDLYSSALELQGEHGHAGNSVLYFSFVAVYLAALKT